MGSFTDTYLRMLIRKMAKRKFDFIYLIAGVVIGALMISALIYRLCCYKNRVPIGETTTTQTLHVTQVDVVRVPSTEASSP